MPDSDYLPASEREEWRKQRALRHDDAETFRDGREWAMIASHAALDDVARELAEALRDSEEWAELAYVRHDDLAAKAALGVLREALARYDAMIGGKG